MLQAHRTRGFSSWEMIPSCGQLDYGSLNQNWEQTVPSRFGACSLCLCGFWVSIQCAVQAVLKLMSGPISDVSVTIAGIWHFWGDFRNLPPFPRCLNDFWTAADRGLALGFAHREAVDSRVFRVLPLELGGSKRDPLNIYSWGGTAKWAPHCCLQPTSYFQQLARTHSAGSQARLSSRTAARY